LAEIAAMAKDSMQIFLVFKKSFFHKIVSKFMVGDNGHYLFKYYLKIN